MSVYELNSTQTGQELNSTQTGHIVVSSQRTADHAKYLAMGHKLNRCKNSC
jgi:hypothetical protein